MYLISNFSSVLEIAFAFNALLYLFELAPENNGRLARLLDNYENIKKEKVELTKNHEAYPIDFALDTAYRLPTLLLGILSIIFSVIALSLLIYSGYNPEAEISGFWITSFLVLFFSVVPICNIIIFYKASSLIQELTNLMATKIIKEKKLRGIE